MEKNQIYFCENYSANGLYVGEVDSPSARMNHRLILRVKKDYQTSLGVRLMSFKECQEGRDMIVITGPRREIFLHPAQEEYCNRLLKRAGI